MDSSTSILGSVTNADLSARSPRPDGVTASGNGSRSNPAQGVTYVTAGDGVVDPMHTGQTPATGNEVNLNFQGADLKDVVQVILGDTLGQTYTIDPKVSGSVTLSTARPVEKGELLSILETLLNMNGADLVRRNNTYQIVEVGSAVASQTSVKGSGPGFGITIIPVRYIGAQTLARLIDGFGARPGAIRVETTRNLLVVAGSGADRQAAIETAGAFDVDWMKDQAVAILPLQNARPEAVIPELERIFAAKGTENGAIQFMPMPRLGAILAVSQSRTLAERAQTWVRRLDRENPDFGQSVHVYRVKYRDATKIAELLQRLFSTSDEEETEGSTPASQPSGETDAAAAAADAGATPDVGTDTAEIDPARFGAPASNGLGADSVRIRADPSNNSIVIYGDLEMRQRVLGALTRIDVPQLQVAISVTMAEVRLTDDMRFGVQYFVKSKSVKAGTDQGSFGLFNVLADNIAREVPGFNFVLGSDSSPDVIISALDAVTDVQILSSPSLVVLENEVARFQVGDQIPIITRTVTPVDTADAPVSNQVEYRDTGIIMNVRPRIAENGVVAMRIEQEISSSSSPNSLTPTISNRSISSSVSVVDGQTVLLGGLISEQAQRGKDGIPGLNRLNVVGNLFGSKNRGNQRTELLIMIRPMVIRDGRDAQSIAQELQSKMWGMSGRKIR
ncbi:type II secretion system secretin GspD [Rhizobium cauense]|uniref:type II secretion system secretin GspD n=1 Tax=Rhizobium cauense TaxID=1166683 RepID=UPI001CB7A100|nr:type II secretion system secretin GspD [Rhizobium cauense]